MGRDVQLPIEYAKVTEVTITEITTAFVALRTIIILNTD